MTDKEKQMLVSEVNIIKDLRHAYIVRYYDRIIDRHNKKIYIVMEYCPCGDLGQFIERHKKAKYESFTLL
jgi:serine/threonine protein kinase